MSISQRITEGSVFVVDGKGVEKPSTKNANQALKEVNVKKSFTFVYSDGDEVLFKSFKNLKNSNLVSVEKLAAIDVICADDLIFSKNALDKYCGEDAWNI